MRILHFADVHARAEDLDEIEKCTGHILEVARAERPDLIIDAGDIFHSQFVRADSPAVKYIHRWMQAMADVAPVARVMGTRSHDGKASEVLDLIGAANHIRTAVDGPLQLVLTRNGNLWDREQYEAVTSGGAPAPIIAVVSLVPAPTKEHLVGLVPGSDIKETDALIAQGLSAMFLGLAASAAEIGNVPHILVGHWNTTGAFISPTQMLTGVDIEVSRDQMMAGNPNLVCLGHIHEAQRIGSAPIFYAGSPQINTWGELDAKGFYIHEKKDDGDYAGAWDHRFIETPTRRRLIVSHDFTRYPANPVSAITVAAADACAPYTIGATVEGAMVRVAIKFYQDEEAIFDDMEIGLPDVFPGAQSIEVVRTRVARANVRAARMLEIERLREKIEQRAAMSGELVPAGVLDKADALEDIDPESLLAAVEAEADGIVPNEDRRAA